MRTVGRAAVLLHAVLLVLAHLGTATPFWHGAHRHRAPGHRRCRLPAVAVHRDHLPFSSVCVGDSYVCGLDSYAHSAHRVHVVQVRRHLRRPRLSPGRHDVASGAHPWGRAARADQTTERRGSCGPACAHPRGATRLLLRYQSDQFAQLNSSSRGGTLRGSGRQRVGCRRQLRLRDFSRPSAACRGARDAANRSNASKHLPPRPMPARGPERGAAYRRHRGDGMASGWDGKCGPRGRYARHRASRPLRCRGAAAVSAAGLIIATVASAPIANGYNLTRRRWAAAAGGVLCRPSFRLVVLRLLVPLLVDVGDPIPAGPVRAAGYLLLWDEPRSHGGAGTGAGRPARPPTDHPPTVRLWPTAQRRAERAA
mmetsp:Transcript_1729/g.5656  ORF Transcript_1729/g.5656 Transcript_1729/m.5656 type:complete len:368 (+) Transcript_1729:1884-2987(+)